MAHYPRLGGSNVDSSAMLSAYFDWTHRATEQELQATVPHLWLVEHRAPGLAQPLRVGGITIPSRPCTTPACNRCTQLWGGYQFRWFGARWLDKYDRVRAWFPRLSRAACRCCKRRPTVGACPICRYRYCRDHIESHWWCCVPPRPPSPPPPSLRHASGVVLCSS